MLIQYQCVVRPTQRSSVGQGGPLEEAFTVGQIAWFVFFRSYVFSKILYQSEHLRITELLMNSSEVRAYLICF